MLLRRRWQPWLLCALLLTLAGLVYPRVGPSELHTARAVVLDAYEALGGRVPSEILRASFGAQDTLPRLEIRLEFVARGFTRPTDLAFVGDRQPAMVVLEQDGKLAQVDMRTGKRQAWFRLEVEDSGNEQGLLGIAIHPRFSENGRFFLNYTRAVEDSVFSFVTEYRCPTPGAPFASKPVRVQELLQLEQPFSNHNGGSLAFGPDGMLYIGFGDGGSANDPHNHGQDRQSWLGSILRIDVDGQSAPLRYRIPTDNPFVGKSEFAPETFAIGVRNPWRMSFDPRGRLIVADVGQDRWEEVGYALRGDNLGWAVMEGKSCHRPKDCDPTGLRLPFLVYDREQGVSVTGGYVVTATSEGALSGLYVYGDYGSGRIWAAALPEPGADASRIFTTGAWPIHPSTFGRDRHGRVYVADHVAGSVYRIAAKQ
jgi:glucose/arabinose dehydrogenase